MKEGLFKSYFGAICVPQIDSANGQIAHVTHDWAHATSGIGGGLAVTMIRLSVRNREVGQAKEKLVEQALAHNVKFLFFIDDDVLVPGDALMKMIQRWRQDPEKYAIQNGVYWSKSEPPQPLIFKGSFEGSYWNWKVGDLIEADGAGAGCTFIAADVFKKLPKPWFSTHYNYDDPRAVLDDQLWQKEDELGQLIRQKSVLTKDQEKRMNDLIDEVSKMHDEMQRLKQTGEVPANLMNGQQSAGAATEDLYFYKKAKEYGGYSCWVDTSIQCGHQDKRSGRIFGMRPDSPQNRPGYLITESKKGKKLLDIGAGIYSPYHDGYDVVRLDIDPEAQPDIIADARSLPIPDQEFDAVFASHVLEHFGFKYTKTILKEWIRVLKVGGELQIVVPNLEFAAERVLEMRDGKPVHQDMAERAMFMYYSAQKDGGAFDYHKAGFTPRALKEVLESLGTLTDVKVVTSDGNKANWQDNPGNYNIIAFAKKIKHDFPVSIHSNLTLQKQEEVKFTNIKDEAIDNNKKSVKNKTKKEGLIKKTLKKIGLTERKDKNE